MTPKPVKILIPTVEEQSKLLSEKLADLTVIKKRCQIARMNEVICQQTRGFRLTNKDDIFTEYGEQWNNYLIPSITRGQKVSPLQMRYHRSWRWLMVAIERILETEDGYFYFSKNKAMFSLNNTFKPPCSATTNSLINSAFNVVYMWALNKQRSSIIQ